MARLLPRPASAQAVHDAFGCASMETCVGGCPLLIRSLWNSTYRRSASSTIPKVWTTSYLPQHAELVSSVAAQLPTLLRRVRRRYSGRSLHHVMHALVRKWPATAPLGQLLPKQFGFIGKGDGGGDEQEHVAAPANPAPAAAAAPPAAVAAAATKTTTTTMAPVLNQSPDERLRALKNMLKIGAIGAEQFKRARRVGKF